MKMVPTREELREAIKRELENTQYGLITHAKVIMDYADFIARQKTKELWDYLGVPLHQHQVDTMERAFSSALRNLVEAGIMAAPAPVETSAVKDPE